MGLQRLVQVEDALVRGVEPRHQLRGHHQEAQRIVRGEEASLLVLLVGLRELVRPHGGVLVLGVLDVDVDLGGDPVVLADLGEHLRRLETGQQFIDLVRVSHSQLTVVSHDLGFEAVAVGAGQVVVHDVLADRLYAFGVGEHRGEAPELAGQGFTVGVVKVEFVGELIEFSLQRLVVHLEEDRMRVQHDRDGRLVLQRAGHRVSVQHPVWVGLLAEEGEGVGGEVPDRGAGHAEELRVRQRCTHLPGQ